MLTAAYWVALVSIGFVYGYCVALRRVTDVIEARGANDPWADDLFWTLIPGPIARHIDRKAKQAAEDGL